MSGSVKLLDGQFPLLVAGLGVLIAFLVPNSTASIPAPLAALSEGMSFLEAPAGSGAVALKLVGSSRFWLGAIGALVCWVCSAAISILFRMVSNNGHYAWQLLRHKLRSRSKT